MESKSVLQPLDDAIRDFQSSLSPEQKNCLGASADIPTHSTLLEFTANVDQEISKRKNRCVSSRLVGILESVQQFSAVVDTFVSSHPQLAGLVWGCVRLTIVVASNYASYFDKLSLFFLHLQNDCLRFAEYRDLYSTSKKLQAALCNYYATVIKLCQKVLQVNHRTGLLHFGMSIWRPFEFEFGSFQRDLKRESKDIREEINLASQFAEANERAYASTHRRQQALHHLEERNWRLQADQRKSKLKREKISRKLSSYNYVAPFKHAYKHRYGTTTSWISQSVEFQSWLSASQSSVFWCSGIVGSGKTVLTANVVDQLCHHSVTSTGRSFFFCQFDNPETLTAKTILGCLIRQFLETGNLFSTFEGQLARLTNSLWDVDDLRPVLEDVLATFPLSFIVLDAIDECDQIERDTLLSILKKVVESSRTKVKIFIASRPGLDQEISKTFKVYHHQSMNSPGLHSDIAEYIKAIIQEKRIDGELKVGNGTLINEIQNTLVKGAQGMFLWVAFQVRDICAQVCDEDIRKVIKNLPKNLPETYDRVLGKIVNADKAILAGKIFRYVAVAKRPLALEELREAIAVEPGQTTRRVDRLINNVDRLLAWCGNLIVLDEEEQVIHFAHFTVKEYFLSSLSPPHLNDFHFQSSKADDDVGRICVTYLNFSDLKRQVVKFQTNDFYIDPDAIPKASMTANLNKPLSKLAQMRKFKTTRDFDVLQQLRCGRVIEDLGSLHKLQSNYPFFAYASQYWLLHTVNFSNEDTEIWELWANMITSEDTLAQLPWSSADWMNCTGVVGKWILKHDHCALLSLMIESRKNDIPSEWREEILIESAAGGHLQILDIIINAGKHSELSLKQAFHEAARRRQIEVVNKFLDVRIDVNGWLVDGRKIQTPLQAAAESGCPKVVKILLASNANINAISSRGQCRTALQVAARHGHLDVMDTLLVFKADVNTPASGEGRTALQLAAENGNIEAVKLLLAAHADVNATPSSDGGRTALQAAAEKGNLEAVESLLRAGADVNAVPASLRGRTALQAAAAGGHLDVLDHLLKAEADVNMPPAICEGRTAMQGAAEFNHFEIVKRLLAAGADLNAAPASDGGRTTIQAAAEMGHLRLVKSLLAADANANGAPAIDHGCTALEAAAGAGHLKIVEKLLAAGASVEGLISHVNANIVPLIGITDSLTDISAQNDHQQAINKLLGIHTGTSAKPMAHQGRTPLQAAAARGHLKVVNRLLEAGAMVNAQSEHYHSALHAACKEGHIDVVHKLLASGAEVNIAPSDASHGTTALQAAAEGGHASVVKVLLTHKANVNDVPTGQGRTALEAATAGGHVETVERLLRAKANVNISSGPLDQTPLQVAREHGHTDIETLLLRAGASTI